MEPLISIIIPIYNVEQYIKDCLESILSQTYTNYEVILVNDGTPDRSAEICKEWIKNNNASQFKLFDKSNGGVSDARNFGLKHCNQQSEYVVFVDSDDELTSDCLDLLIRKASHDSLVIGNLLRCRKNNVPQNDNKDTIGISYSEIWHNKDFLSHLRDGIINSCCGNCYSLNVIRANKLLFKKLFPEDTFFNFEYLLVVSNVIFIERPVYLYYIWDNTITTKPKEEIYINYMVIQQSLYEMVDIADYELIDRFVYPQYRVNTMNFIKNGEYYIPRKNMQNELIKRAMSSYSPVSFADWIVHFCLKHSLFRIARFF